MAIISKGLTLEWKTQNPYGTAIDAYFTAGEQEGTFDPMEEHRIFPGLQEISELAITGSVAGDYDQIEVTTLADNKHMYVDGLMADSATSGNSINCKFLYEPKLFKAFSDTVAAESVGDQEGHNEYDIMIGNKGDAGQFTFKASIANVAMDTVSVNSALTFVVTFSIRSIEFFPKF